MNAELLPERTRWLRLDTLARADHRVQHDGGTAHHHVDHDDDEVMPDAEAIRRDLAGRPPWTCPRCGAVVTAESYEADHARALDRRARDHYDMRLERRAAGWTLRWGRSGDVAVLPEVLPDLDEVEAALDLHVPVR